MIFQIPLEQIEREMKVKETLLDWMTKIDVKDYLAQYYIGHYNPRGNHFCAFAIKGQLVQMLDPKPAPYLQDAAVLP